MRHPEGLIPQPGMMLWHRDPAIVIDGESVVRNTLLAVEHRHGVVQGQALSIEEL